MTGPPAISLRNVKKFYGKFELGPLDLEIEPGYVVAVVGPNGSGKSTLIKLLMNLIHPDSGTVTLFGGNYPDDEVPIKQHIGYVPETSVGHDEMSAKTLNEFVSRFYPDWDQSLFEDLVTQLRIEREKRFDELSKGVRRRLAFALAVATSPELLLLDEPTAGVDPFARREMLEEISRFVNHGGRSSSDRTVVFATHALEEARRLADYVVFLADGKLLGLHEKDTLFERWRIFWVDGELDRDVPGIVEVEDGNPTRIISDSARETAEALSARNMRIVRSGTLDLDEMLSYLMQRSRERHSV